MPLQYETRGHQQVLLTWAASTSGGNENANIDGATLGGYKNNSSGQNNNNNANNNNNNGSRSRIQYDVNGQSIVQCRACNLWGHFARECPTANTPKLLCRWCGLGDHEDAKCPKSGVNLITVRTDEEEVLAITRRQAKVYPESAKEKRKLGEVRAEIKKASQVETSQLKDATDTSTRNCAEQNIINQVMQMEVPIKLSDLLTMHQLRTAILNYTASESNGGNKKGQ